MSDQRSNSGTNGGASAGGASDASAQTSGHQGPSGPIGKPGLAALLRRVAQMSFSGVLYLRRGENRRRLYLTNGTLVLATSTVPGERLGDYLGLLGCHFPPRSELKLAT